DADVKEFYGEIITIEVPKGFTNSQTKIECLYDGEQLTNVKVVNEYTKGDERIYVTYEKEDEGTLNTNSTIDKQELALRYNKVNEEFVAKYIDEGKLYSIKTENMTQEDFITFLVKFVK
ncbi:hypothetical protein LJC02_04670, partial [Breznakia sp. OttesenSCG-928-G09]|nr:hypothetical protein [Breznakia sp. OttesenSCG-928-G09]